MRLLKKAAGVWPRSAVALAAVLAAGAVAAPLSVADDTQNTAQEAPAGESDLLLKKPEVPRISDGAYSGFQFCGDPNNKPLVTTVDPSLAATLESVAPPGSEAPQRPDEPGRKVVFEVTEADGKPVLQKKATSETSHTAVYQVLEGKLPDGDYRWRVRVQDEAVTSEWTTWCDFTVRLAK